MGRSVLWSFMADSETKPAFERVLDSLADALRDHDGRRRFTTGIKIWFRRACWGGAIVYSLGLVLGLAFLEWFGDCFWWTFPMIYVPPALFALPAPLIIGPCVLFARKALIPIACALIILAFFYTDYELPWPKRSASGQEIRVLTNNIGQKNRKPLTPFVTRIDPDLIVLQDAARYGSRYAQQYDQHTVVYHGEFIIASRFPVTASGMVPGIECEGAPVAAWADLDVGGCPVKVVNVHIRTPRRILGHLMGLGYLKEFVRAYLFFQPLKQSPIRQGIQERISAVQALAEFLEAQEMPVIVLGDFNFPNHGWQFHRLRKNHNDAFEKGGRGYGYTFPGRTNNPLAFFRAWLRLDHIFVSPRHFKITRALAEPDRESQHRAMSATLVLKTS